MSHNANPYSASNPDSELGLIRRGKVDDKLDACIAYSRPPALVAIIAERGMGGTVAVRSYLNARQATLPFRLVHCDAKSRSLESGRSTQEFYKKLVALVFEAHPDNAAFELAREIADTNLNTPDEKFQKNLFAFFQRMKETDPARPLMLVFYNFDRLPKQFPFAGSDWAWLRELHDKPNCRLFYIVSTRRSLDYVEKLYGLQDSLFASRFAGNARRIGLLSEQEAHNILDAAQWSKTLRAKLKEWGGTHPYCLQFLCFQMYERRQLEIDATEAGRLTNDWLRPEYLGDYFQRLLENLRQDKLLDPLLHAVTEGYHTPYHSELLDLVELGYFAPHPAYPPDLSKMEYKLFSPLFHRYLVLRGVLPDDPSDGPRPVVPPPNWPPPQLVNESLTPRETEVLWLMVTEGITMNKELAPRLFISEETVKGYIRNLFAKFGVNNRKELVARVKSYAS